MRYLRLFLVFFRVGVLGELSYRSNFVMHLIESIMELGTALAGLAVVFSYTSTLGGWRPAEILALVGVYFLVSGAIRMVIQPSMERLIEGVHEGTLDFTLTKPEDAQLLVSIQRVEIWNITDVVLGSGVLAVALVRLGANVGVSEAAGFAAALAAGGIIVYSFWLMLATLAFWFVRVENMLMIFSSMYEAGRWPVGFYPRWLRFMLTFLIPVAFATTVPAQALAGRLSVSTLAGAYALAAVLAVLSRAFWRVGVRRYSSASS
ncbi:MAG: ABC transporter permease [Candidatus Aminicenantes bacterium RBG_16_63_16]|nr:MAG: ABC transporter permease [Candidatus Aminicenantes bacterium RBG_16_63_16]